MRFTMLLLFQSIIFLLSDTTVHIFIGAYHFEEGRTTYYFSTKTWKFSML